MDLSSAGKILLAIGLCLAVLGGLLLLGGKVPFLGRLPGDFRWEGEHSSFYFPLTTCLLLSVCVSAILWIVSKLK